MIIETDQPHFVLRKVSAERGAADTITETGQWAGRVDDVAAEVERL